MKTDDENIYISISGADSTGSAEIIFSGKAQPGVTASDVNVDEVFVFFSVQLITLTLRAILRQIFFLFLMIPAFLVNFSLTHYFFGKMRI